MALRGEVQRLTIGHDKDGLLAVERVDNRPQVFGGLIPSQLYLINIVAAAPALGLVAHEVEVVPTGRIRGRRLVVLRVDAAAQGLGLVSGDAAQVRFEQIVAALVGVHQQALAVGREAHGGIVVFGVHRRAQIGGGSPFFTLPRRLVHALKVAVAHLVSGTLAASGRRNVKSSVVSSAATTGP